jgi:hypothetical protein
MEVKAGKQGLGARSQDSVGDRSPPTGGKHLLSIVAKGRVDLEAFGAYGASGQKDFENSFVVHIRSAWVSPRLLRQGCQAAGEDSGQERCQQGRRRIQGGAVFGSKDPEA